MTTNYNCDGGYCARPDGETRVYPLGSGGNLILCETCFAWENRYRASRGGERAGWPAVAWDTAERYPEKNEAESATVPPSPEAF